MRRSMATLRKAASTLRAWSSTSTSWRPLSCPIGAGVGEQLQAHGAGDADVVLLAGEAYVQNNTGTAGVTVSGNSIKGTLTCTGNTPAPTDNGSVHTVSGTADGQRAGIAEG